jgi:hypothetical protein
MFELFFAGLLAARRTGLAGLGPVEAPSLGTAKIAQLALACLVLVAAFVAELRVIDVAAATQVPMPPWFARLPLVPIDENPPLNGHTPPWVGNDLLALATLQCGALYALYRSLRGRTLGIVGTVLVACACAALLGCALATHATAAGADLYLNVGYGHLGIDAYATPARPFPGEFVAINRLLGVPILSAAYGPLWIFVASAIVNAFGTLATQLQALRVAGALAFVACAFCLRAAGVTPAGVALFALNPALVFQYVVDAHNDIFPLAFALLALAVARRAPWLALICVVCAGAMKLPFAVAGALAFAQLPERGRRIAFAAAALALSLAATELGSGGRYFVSVTYALGYQRLDDPFDRLGHALAIAAAAGTFALALWARRFIASGSWTFLAFGAIVLPWYAAWGIPYAVLQRTFLPVYLILLPLLAFDLSTTFGLTPAARLLFIVVMLSPLVYLIQQRRSAHGAVPSDRKAVLS